MNLTDALAALHTALTAANAGVDLDTDALDRAATHLDDAAMLLEARKPATGAAKGQIVKASAILHTPAQHAAFVAALV